MTAEQNVRTIAFHSHCDHVPSRSGHIPRLHILRTVPRRQSYRAAEQFRRPEAEVGWCGTAAWGHRHDISPLPAEPPPGVRWCGPCVGRYADHVGALGALAALLARLNQPTTPAREESS